VITEGNDSNRLPLLEGKDAIDDTATAYVCENFVCQRPVTDVEELKAALAT
jgi:uncharacterized protein